MLQLLGTMVYLVGALMAGMVLVRSLMDYRADIRDALTGAVAGSALSKRVRIVGRPRRAPSLRLRPKPVTLRAAA